MVKVQGGKLAEQAQANAPSIPTLRTTRAQTQQLAQAGKAGGEVESIYNDIDQAAEGTEEFTRGTKIPEEILKNKPLYSPEVNKWLEGGGRITIEKGTWKYTNSQGISVTYKKGYPDFKASGLVLQEVDIGPFRDRPADFRLADQLAPNGPRGPLSTWHHHEDGRTLQEVNRRLHEMFTHRGGISVKKRGGN